MAIQYDTLAEFQDLVKANKNLTPDFQDWAIDGNIKVSIEWQHGGTATTDRNGAFIEDVLAIVYARLDAFNQEFPCRENSIALTKIEEAVLWLAQRKAERDHRGVYGTEQK